MSITEEELYSLSFDTIEEDATNPWFSLIQNLSFDKLKRLREIFKEKCDENEEEIGMNEAEFLNTICHLYGSSKYSLQSNLLFKEIERAIEKPLIKWNDFLDFLIDNLEPKVVLPVTLSLRTIEDVSHAKRETVAKIVLIESKSYFCYAIITKHGRVGLYDGNMNFLTSYHVIMTREDITLSEAERRRRNRWVTDAIFCEDVQIFMVTNSARTLMIYEASGLKHVPYWLITGLPDIAQGLAYKNINNIKSKDGEAVSTLFFGCFKGDLLQFKFMLPQNELLRRKHAHSVSVFYWDELFHEKKYLDIKVIKRTHNDTINKIKYYPEEDCIISCSSDPNCSLIKKFLSHVKKPYIYKMQRGCTCFSSSTKMKLLVTGSPDGVIRMWNPVITSKPTANLLGHFVRIVDVAIMENQEILLSISKDGVIKSWDLKQMTCLQTLKIKFPSFKVQGKFIEFGTDSIHPGPKREVAKEKEETNLNKCFSLDDVVEQVDEETEGVEELCLGRWERSNVLITCCNHIAKVDLLFKDIEVVENFENPVLPPPPLQSSVLIPSTWKIQERKVEEIGEQEFDIDVDKLMEEVDFILSKDLLDRDGARSDINHKIAILETRKMQMQAHVARGAPYLALKLYDIEDLRLSSGLPVSNKTRNLVTRIENLLLDASKKDIIFSEPSSSRSKSSISSIVDLSL